MKYILPQGRLFDSIHSYIDKYFEELELGWAYAPNEDDDNYDENIIEYFDTQYGNYEFQYIKKEYYENLMNNDLEYNVEFVDRWLDKAPLLEITDSLLPKRLNKIFDSNIWEPVFVKWFEDKYNLPVKTFVNR